MVVLGSKVGVERPVVLLRHCSVTNIVQPRRAYRNPCPEIIGNLLRVIHASCRPAAKTDEPLTYNEIVGDLEGMKFLGGGCGRLYWMI